MYKDQPVPEYEKSARAVDVLYKFAEYNEERDKDVSLLIENMNKQATEYQEEANSLEDLLKESLDLFLSSLSSEGTNCLMFLVNTAMTLETKDTSLACFFAAICEMTSLQYATQLKNRKKKLKLRDINKNLTSMLALEQQLKDDIKETQGKLQIRREKMNRLLHNMEFLKHKCEELKMKIRSVEEKITATGLEQSLTHESLMNLSKKLSELQAEVVPLDKELEYYQDLTPNPSLAQVKIEEVKQELAVMDEEITKRIQKLTGDMSEFRRL
ncbi:HAUS augmin-like complex subunit 1 isoform X2 [Colius striatus]|nr:HAUS augmin-like complex subunit 1 isoform X2 [Colius striatus]XP_061874147.1 HAUS augmin-like complex subunit 1 isoform X2 [Colius striatus]